MDQAIGSRYEDSGTCPAGAAKGVRVMARALLPLHAGRHVLDSAEPPRRYNQRQSASCVRATAEPRADAVHWGAADAMGRADDARRERRSRRLTCGFRRPAGPASSSSGFLAGLARLGRAAAFASMVGGGAAAMLTAVGFANPAFGEVLVSNINLSAAGQPTLQEGIAQRFTTGPNQNGYTLTSIELHIRNTFVRATVKLATSLPSTRSSQDDAVVAILANPAVATPGIREFTAPPGTTLSPNTTYYVVLDGPNGSGRVQGTSSNAEESGAHAGWSIGDRAHWSTGPTTRNWRLHTTYSLKLRVNGSANSPPNVSSAALTDDYKITVNFDQPLGSRSTDCPSRAAWTVNYNDDSAWPYQITCHDRSVVLYSRTHNQSPALAKHRTVTVSYNSTYHRLFRLRSRFGVDVASFSNQPVTNAYPLLAGASVNGKVLTLTYDQPLDASSRPAASAFGVHMASTWMTRGGGFGMPNPVVGRSISGAAVTLTLEHPVPHNAYVSLRYNPPASNPLRNVAGGKAKAITGSRLDTLPVTVLTPDTGEPPALHSAGVKQHRFTRDGSWAQETWLWMVFDESLDQGSAPAASAFTVRAASTGGRARAPSRWRATRSSHHDEVRIRLGEDIPEGDAVTVSYDKPTANPLRDPEGNEVESFSGKIANNGGAPRIESLALVSDPGSDRTYGHGEKVRVQVNFSEPVVVSGTPLMRIILGRTGLQTGDWKWVSLRERQRDDGADLRLHRAGRGFNGRFGGQRRRRHRREQHSESERRTNQVHVVPAVARCGSHGFQVAALRRQSQGGRVAQGADVLREARRWKRRR